MGLMYRRYALIPVEAGWRIWDTREDRWIGKFGQPDSDYFAERREVAAMRVRDFASFARIPREVSA